MSKDNYQIGYDDGFRNKEMMVKHDNMPAYEEYFKGWSKGKEDKAFCEAYSDEALGVAGYGP